jgi:TonB family protein
MTKYTYILLALLLPLGLKAQKVTVSKVSSSKINAKAIDVEPSFPGGTKAFYKYISKNIAYEKDAKATDMQGTVTVSMAIETDGSISEAQITSGVSDVVDREVLRVINASPKWKPGMQHGRPIKVRYTFKIQLSNT